VWSKSYLEADLQKDLISGVSSYPGTALPGAAGNALVAGHSSNYAWKPYRKNKLIVCRQKEAG